MAVREYFVPLAKDIMSEDLVTIKGDEDAAYAAQIMVANGIGALPVVDDEGRLIGLITKHEFVKAVASS
ncbi:inosine 5'-monophosphate dehydrogenase [compost metagenome]